jgi:hypothetical protein
LIRSTFKPKAAPARRDRSAEFENFKPKPREAAQVPGLVKAFGDIFGLELKPAPSTKTPGRKRQDIRDSARGEECLVRLPGCPGDSSLTIWSHNRHNRAGKARGMKAIDLNGCYACGPWCDAIYDGQRKPPDGMTREAVELAWYHAHAESLVRLAQKGLL